MVVFPLDIPTGMTKAIAIRNTCLTFHPGNSLFVMKAPTFIHNKITAMGLI